VEHQVRTGKYVRLEFRTLNFWEVRAGSKDVKDRCRKAAFSAVSSPSEPRGYQGSGPVLRWTDFFCAQPGAGGRSWRFKRWFSGVQTPARNAGCHAMDLRQAPMGRPTSKGHRDRAGAGRRVLALAGRSSVGSRGLHGGCRLVRRLHAPTRHADLPVDGAAARAPGPGAPGEPGSVPVGFLVQAVATARSGPKGSVSYRWPSRLFKGNRHAWRLHQGLVPPTRVHNSVSLGFVAMPWQIWRADPTEPSSRIRGGTSRSHRHVPRSARTGRHQRLAQKTFFYNNKITVMLTSNSLMLTDNVYPYCTTLHLLFALYFPEDVMTCHPQKAAAGSIRRDLPGGAGELVLMGGRIEVVRSATTPTRGAGKLCRRTWASSSTRRTSGTRLLSGLRRCPSPLCWPAVDDAIAVAAKRGQRQRLPARTGCRR
jgi:hypothetical protein